MLPNHSSLEPRLIKKALQENVNLNTICSLDEAGKPELLTFIWRSTSLRKVDGRLIMCYHCLYAFNLSLSWSLGVLFGTTGDETSSPGPDQGYVCLGFWSPLWWCSYKELTLNTMDRQTGNKLNKPLKIVN